ncbi:neuroligin-2-like [Oppia nitens]|uniref:neuroligin-2-like n=1 Tax=Oppia nitens TaxID=1686743 RepID=UPI0023DBFE47|nr:neuroligin-2-like [Oppia nitens]
MGSPNRYNPIRSFWKNVTTFLGIPYARPPIREYNLRFQPPSPPTPWGSIFADRYQNSCPQYITHIGKDLGIPVTDEDCLYLNIFTPWAMSRVRDPYPVMMYIHGGFFDHGSGNTFAGHMLAASQEVVVVTFNYRLGLLGYLATADNASAGNFGLMDQIQAINWVRDNIRNFNGDPDRITLFGPDAGAASAGLLAISPITRRYIKRVIAQSGSPVADWAFIRDPLFMRNTSVVAGYAFGCRTRHTYNLVECLKSRSAIDFTTTQVKPDVGWLAWAPVVDQFTRERGYQTIPDIPENLLHENRVEFDPEFAYMTGVTRDEGSKFLFADEELKLRNYVVDADYVHKKIADYVRIYNYTLDQDAVVRAIKFMYSPWSDPNNLTLIRQGYIDMLTDSWFTAANDKMVKLMLQNNVRTYMYVLNYTIEGLNLPDWIGVPHDTEYLLATGAPFMDSRFHPSSLQLDQAVWTEADRNMSQLIMESWANFARYPNCRLPHDSLRPPLQPPPPPIPAENLDNLRRVSPANWCGPTPFALFNTILWEPMNQKNLQYLSINSTNYTGYWQTTTWENNQLSNINLNAWSTSVMWRDYKQKASQFWNHYMPSIVDRVPPTWPPTYEPYEIELRLYRSATWSVLAALVVLLVLVFLCSCLYCRAKSDRYGDAGIDEYIHIPDIATMGTQYSAPSTRVNSEINLSFHPKSEYPRSKFRSNDKIYVARDKHTQV